MGVGENDFGVALDTGGNLYFTDSNGTTGSVNWLNFATAPTLNFPNTVVNFASNPQTVTVANIGNEPLAFSSFLYPGTTSLSIPELPAIATLATSCCPAIPAQ